MRTIRPILLGMIFLFTLVVSAAEEKPLSGLKTVFVWSIPGNQIEKAVLSAKVLGFNAVGWKKDCVAACHKHGMKAIKVLEPLKPRDGGIDQVLRPGDEKLPGFDKKAIKPEHKFQYGGEPAPGNKEILDRSFVCPQDPGVVAYTTGEVEKVKRQGYDGVCWDFVGYRNYYCCECAACKKGLAAFRKEQATLSEEAARTAYYEKLLVEAYEKIFDAARKAAPKMIIITHCHPVYLPNPFHGHKIKVEYCGVTVSWFFKPHWPLDKIRTYTKKTVNGPYAHNGAEGMPMIGYYGDRGLEAHRRTPERLKAEFDILKAEGAKHLMMCELGHIIRDEAIAKVVKEALTGK